MALASQKHSWIRGCDELNLYPHKITMLKPPLLVAQNVTVVRDRFFKEIFNGVPGWMSRLSVELSVSAHVMTSGSWD